MENVSNGELRFFQTFTETKLPDEETFEFVIFQRVFKPFLESFAGQKTKKTVEKIPTIH